MKIYFAGSIRSGRDDRDLYVKIIDYLKTFGEVLTEHIGDASLTSFGENGVTDDFIHDRDMKWLLDSDTIVAEVTNPSLGIGYELGRAIEHNKKIICLFRRQDGKRLSAMIAGSKNILCKEYKDFNSLKEIIKKHIN